MPTLAEILSLAVPLQRDKLTQLLRFAPPEIFGKAEIRVVKAGQLVLAAGEEADRVFLLIAGQLRGISEFLPGQMYAFTEFLPLVIIGELEVLADVQTYLVSIEAVRDSRLIVIRKADFMDWVTRDAHAMMILYRMIAAMFYDQAEKDRSLLLLSGIERLKTWLLRVYTSRADVSGNLTLKKTRQEIADETGLCVKTVNRCMKTLTMQNMVSAHRGSITLNARQYKALVSMKK